MNIQGIRTLSGPNVYSHRPALLMRLDLGDLYEKESYEVPGFVERLLALLPGLREHHCSKGYAGGFVERLEEGTYFGHTVEHVALELAGLAGCTATHGKTRYSGDGRVYNVVMEFCAEHATRYLLAQAAEVAKLLCAAVGDEWPGTECRVVPDEIEAMREELQALEDGQVVVIFYDQLEPVQRVLEEHGALPVGAIGEAMRHPQGVAR
jgi:hypothetical protein